MYLLKNRVDKRLVPPPQLFFFRASHHFWTFVKYRPTIAFFCLFPNKKKNVTFWTDDLQVKVTLLNFFLFFPDIVKQKKRQTSTDDLLLKVTLYVFFLPSHTFWIIIKLFDFNMFITIIYICFFEEWICYVKKCM